MNIPQDRLQMACLALKDNLPDITPARLSIALEIGYDEAKERVELVSVNQAAEILQVCPMTVYRMVSRGELTRHPVGRGRAYRLNRFELLGRAA